MSRMVKSENHEIIGKSPKSGVRPHARTPDFGYSLNFREVLELCPV
jgi:hypothetical protein